MLYESINFTETLISIRSKFYGLVNTVNNVSPLL